MAMQAMTGQAGDSGDGNGAPRKKKWGHRARTGCATCRARHVKCDETHPVCKKCLTAGRVCSGINYGAGSGMPTRARHHGPALSILSGSETARERSTDHDGLGGEAAAVNERAEERRWGSSNSMRAMALSGREREMRLTRDLVPQGWHFSEACQYFNEVMLTRRLAKQIVPSDFHYPAGNTKQKFSPPPDHQHTVIMIALAHRISFLFHAEERGTSQLCQHRATAQLRTCFYRHMGEAIRALNRHLVDVDMSGVIWGLRKIANIVSAELYMVSTSWRHHVEGFLALVKHGGGAYKILNHFPPIRLAIYYMTVIANVANTTSPSHDLGTGCMYPGRDETRHLYSSTLYPSFPCPTSLFMDMMRITELRNQQRNCAASRDAQLQLRQSIVEVFTSIDAFEPDGWTERYQLPRTRDIGMIARTYKASVALYGVLGLGKSQACWIGAAAARPFFPSLTKPNSNSGGTGTGTGTYGSLRRALSRHLGVVVEEAMRTLSNQESLSWPLSVLGVGVADGTAAEREFVKKSLFEVGMDPNADAGPMDSRGMLLEFWQSGRMQWDECFRRPTLVLA
ncbi:hypothetical protein E4U43_007880 [Claviceps pusilla]|uniref:Zn(2)-C6 fungal-type domain-containing protein n=1 Tax=Claviceps pusilla TaxID=123648 RepID=A0A9P7NCA5_9HYPO|nr:hypothetical protein E4U43_007880 [Claviceps pusilla]